MSGVEIVETEETIERKLDKDQVDALVALLRDESLDESDADLILGFLRAYSESVIELVPLLPCL